MRSSLRQQAQFVAQRAQILPARLIFSNAPRHVRQPPRDGLEIDVVLEQNAGDVAEPAGILSQHGVFELQHVDRAQINLAMDQPGEIGVAEFARRVRLDRSERLSAGRPCARCTRTDAQMRSSSSCASRSCSMIQQDDQMQIAKPREFANGLVHEDAAAVDRRADRIRGDEQDAAGGRGLAMSGRKCRESGRPADGGRLRVSEIVRERLCAPARSKRPRQAAKPRARCLRSWRAPANRRRASSASRRPR